jgi:hypothetical protein
MRALGFLFVLLTAGSAECDQNRSIDFGVMQPYEAHVIEASGQVSRVRDAQAWAVSSGERVRVQQLITTGADGYAKFVVAGGSFFEVFSDSRLVFRQNTANVGDLLDVIGGRVRVHLQPAIGQAQQRVFTPTAIVIARQPATIAIAIDEDNAVRIDVLEGEVAVQHALLPNGPTMVKAIDAILVRPDEAISRRVDRGSLYRYTMKPFHDLWSSVARIGGKDTKETNESQKLLATNSTRHLSMRF